MAQLTPLDFIAKWQLRFQPNTTFQIEEADLQEFATDIADTFGVRVENVPAYVAGTTYAAKFLVRYTPAGEQEGFYYSLQTGVLGTPGPANLLEWKEMPRPPLPAALSQFITLAQARNMNGDTVVLGRDYEIELPQPSASGHAQYLSVAGIAEFWFASDGWLIANNVRTKVKNIDYVTGTWEVDASYTKAQTDALLATKQGAVTGKSRFTVYGPSATLPATHIDTLCLLATGGDAVIDLPIPTLTDVGKMLIIDHYSGSGNEANATFRILLPGSATFATPPPPQVLAVAPRRYVAEFKALLEVRGTPYDDVIATWACTANSQAVPAPKADLVGNTVPTNQLPGFVRTLYTMQPADVALPIQPLTITVANALYFANVQVVGTPQLVYGSHYTSTPGQLTLAASVVASLQPGDLLRYSYQLGGVGATASTFGQLGGAPTDNAALSAALAGKAVLSQFVGTLSQPQAVVKDAFYYIPGKGLYKRIGADATVASLDTSNTASWLVLLEQVEEVDVFPSQAKRTDVINRFTAGQKKTADVALAGDTKSYFFSKFYHFPSDYYYECLPNPDDVDANGVPKPWWVKLANN